MSYTRVAGALQVHPQWQMRCWCTLSGRCVAGASSVAGALLVHSQWQVRGWYTLSGRCVAGAPSVAGALLVHPNKCDSANEGRHSNEFCAVNLGS